MGNSGKDWQLPSAMGGIQENPVVNIIIIGVIPVHSPDGSVTAALRKLGIDSVA